MTHDTEVNKKNAIAFYRTAIPGETARAVELYVGDEYIQHNPSRCNGKAGFIEYFVRMTEAYPSKEIEFVRTVAEDDLVAVYRSSDLAG